jgi:UMF1 family MFS transporter
MVSMHPVNPSLVTPGMPHRRGRIAWIAYDLALHGYGLLIPAVAYAVYFTSYVAADTGQGEALWAFAVAASLVIAGLLSPWVGALADGSGRGRALLGAATLACGGATAMLATVGRGDVLAGIALFVFAHVAASLATSLYNGFLPVVSGRQGMARLSGLAWGLSYFGSIGCFLLCLPFTQAGISPETAGRFVLAFVVTAAFFLVVGLPSAMALPVTAKPARADVRGAYRRVLDTVRSWRRDREMPKFLLAYYLINDAIVTVIFFTSVMFNRTFGLSVQEVLVLSLAFQAIAIPCTAFFGWLGERWDQRRAIYVTLALWLLALALMATVSGWAGALAIAISLGIVLGSTQSLLRSLFAVMVPAGRESEYFGFHALAGRASSAVGPLFFAIVSAATGSQRWAMASLALFFIAGAIVLATVRLPSARAGQPLTRS